MERVDELIKVYKEEYFTSIIVRHYFPNIPKVTIQHYTYPNDMITDEVREIYEKYDKDVDIDLVETWKQADIHATTVVLRDGSHY